MDIAREARPSPAAPIALGMLGIAGGLGILAAFVIDIPPPVNTWRIVLFSAAAIAIAVATFPPQAALDRRLAVAGALPLIVASAGSIVWTLLAIGRPSPFSGAFGLVGFWIGLAMWLGHAWFGTVALRIGSVPRLAAMMLAAGSILAVLGMDRLELTSSSHPTIFGPLSLVGIALNATAWMILGVAVLRRTRRRSPTRTARWRAADDQPSSRA